ncbi:hypothetical protein PUN28_019242 [Cardiocondyla obscurior]|uniref:Uncharacterized protein n=1 Tax=Cardiocondyla obscurior TaxID=286306 RepID=A0AAW2EEH1_9HYME
MHLAFGAVKATNYVRILETRYSLRPVIYLRNDKAVINNTKSIASTNVQSRSRTDCNKQPLDRKSERQRARPRLSADDERRPPSNHENLIEGLSGKDNFLGISRGAGGQLVG